jgi:hypothetical protein
MSTRQVTPGPSNGVFLQPQNVSLKRPLSEGEGDGDGEYATKQKRAKKEDGAVEGALGGPNNKDKKKRKKKRRKLSIVVATTAEPDIARSRSRSRPRSATAPAQPQTRASPSDTKPSANVATPAVVNGTSGLNVKEDASHTTVSTISPFSFFILISLSPISHTWTKAKVKRRNRVKHLNHQLHQHLSNPQQPRSRVSPRNWRPKAL